MGSHVGREHSAIKEREESAKPFRELQFFHDWNTGLLEKDGGTGMGRGHFLMETQELFCFHIKMVS